MNKLLRTTLVSVFVAAGTAPLALAQTTQNSDPRSVTTSPRSFADRPFSRPSERVEARLAYVRTALQITDAQQPQWDAYANLVRKHAQDMEQRVQSRQSSKPGSEQRKRPNAIERLERAQTFHAQAVTRINEILAVEKPLYAALSPAQQEVADVVMNRRVRSVQTPPMHRHGGFGRG